MTLTFRARDRTTVVARACFCLYAAVSAEKVTVLAGRTLGGIVRCACSSRGASSSRARADFCRLSLGPTNCGEGEAAHPHEPRPRAPRRHSCRPYVCPHPLAPLPLFRLLGFLRLLLLLERKTVRARVTVHFRKGSGPPGPARRLDILFFSLFLRSKVAPNHSATLQAKLPGKAPKVKVLVLV